MEKEKDRDQVKPTALQTVWVVYLYSMRAFLAYLENGMEKLTLNVTKHPKRVLLVAVFVIGLSCLGLLRFKSETRTIELLVPKNTPSDEALKNGKPFFRNIYNARTEEILFTPKHEKNVLSENCLPEMISVVKRINVLSGYSRLCYPVPEFIKTGKNVSVSTCRQTNVLEIFSNNIRNDTIIYDAFNEALSNYSMLLSNGRNFQITLRETVAGFNIDTSSKTVTGKAIRILMYMKQDTESKDTFEWEKSFIVALKEIRGSLKNVSLYYSAERSMDDAIGSSSSNDIGLISVTFTIMSTFCCLVLAKFVNPVQGHNLLAFFGVVSTALGILCGIGLTMLFGVPFIRLAGIVPFLVVSIGIDDMFIIVDEFDRQSPQFSPRKRVSNAMAKVGSTITMTTLTDIIAFIVGTSSAFYDVKYFCIYTAMCISVEFFFQITVFVVFLYFDAKRIKMKRNACIPVLNAPDKNCVNLTKSTTISARILQTYGTFLLKLPVKCFVILLTLAMVAFGIFGCMNVDTRFNRSTLALPSSEFSNYVNVLESNFPLTIPVSIQITDKVNYADQRVREEIAGSVAIAYSTGFSLSRNVSWVHSFEAFTKQKNISANGKKFQSALHQFLSIPAYQQFKLDVRFDKEGNIAASRVIVYYKDTKDSNTQKDAMLKLRSDLKQQSKIPFEVIGDPFIYFEQYAVIIEEVVKNLISVSCVIALLLIPFCIHPGIVLIILLGFGSLVVELFGLMYIWDVQLNTITMITLVMSIGFTVDYSAHIAQAFVTSRKSTVDGKIKEALTTIGGSVFLGASSTFLGMALLGFANSPIFQIFFKMFVGIIILGLYNGMVLLPVLLSTFKCNLDFQFSFPWKKFFASKRTDSSKRSYTKQNRLITVLGISARVPTARTKDEFWELLKEGRRTVGDYPDERHGRKMKFSESFNPIRSVPGKIYVTRGSYVENISGFDYTFFGISAAEARLMDPQQRLLLQGTYEAIEDAGMTVDELQQCTTGVYVGIMNQDYSSVALGPDSLPNIDQFAATGNAFSIAANRISFSFNLSGPSIAMDTACSSSLTALSIACDHIKRGVVDVAIVAGANIILDPTQQAPICRAGMLASDGQCKVFDERADGYGRGEAVFVFILKGSDFVNSTDQPYGEIIAWGLNNDGQTAAPITAPSIEGQVRLMQNVLREVSLNPSDVQVMEMHGTGTIIGDSVEVNSVGDVYGRMRSSENPIIVGSVKSNINHTESAAGLAGLAKVCLMMKYGELVPTVGIEKKATRLALESTGLHVQMENAKWPEPVANQPRIAAVNSFGFGGSNAHIIIQQQQPVSRIDNQSSLLESNSQILILSARSKLALQKLAGKVSKWLAPIENSSENRRNICYTMSERRTEHSVRLAVDMGSLPKASNVLEQFSESPDEKRVEIHYERTNKLCLNTVFVFGGQGSQWIGMAGDLIRQTEIFKTIRIIDKKARKYGLTGSLLQYLQGAQESGEIIQEDLVIVQLSIFALQYAVAQYLIEKACIVPTFVTGHSLGDITAACVARIIAMKSAIKVIMTRGTLQTSCSMKGAMTAIGMSKKDVIAITERLNISENLCIAAENTAKSVTVSGDIESIEIIENYLKEEKSSIFVRRLATDKAFHSHHMEQMKWKFMNKINENKIIAKSAEMRFFSTTEGKEMNGSEINDAYWWKNLRHTVLFSQCIEKLMKIGARSYVEISPRPVLSNYILEIGKQSEITDLTVIQALPARKEVQRLVHLHVQCIGHMYTLGYPVNWRQINNCTSAQFVRYPTYPWQETELWVNDNYQGAVKAFPLLGNPVTVDSKEITWNTDIDVHSFSYLRDHELQSIGTIFPGACFIELALEAFMMQKSVVPVILKNIAFQKTLPLDERSVRKLECKRYTSENSETGKFEVYHTTEHGKILLSSASLTSKRDIKIESSKSLAASIAGSVNLGVVNEGTLSCANLTNDKVAMADDKTLQKYGLISNANQNIGHINTGFTADSYDVEIEADIQLLQLAGLCHREDKQKVETYQSLVEQSGFIFGKRFSMMESVWARNGKAMARLQLADELKQEIKDYVFHPCILDACLQTRLFVEADGGGKLPRTIPTGVEELQLYPLPSDIKYLYCLCEKITATNSCIFRLMDEKQNLILKINGLQVKEYSVHERNPKIEDSVFDVVLERLSVVNQKESKIQKKMFVVFAEKSSPYLPVFLEAFQEMNVERSNLVVTEIDERDNIIQLIEDTIEKALNAKKDMIVLNLLSFVSNGLQLDPKTVEMPEFFCFEVNLKLLQFLHAKKIDNCKILTFSCRNVDDIYHGDPAAKPWSGVCLGMARTTNMESKVPLVCIELVEGFQKDAVIKSIASLDLPNAKEGLVIENDEILQPSLSKYDPKNSQDDLFRFAGEQFYLSWSNAEEKFTAKEIRADSLIGEDEVEIEVLYVSSANGKCEELLENVKSYTSTPILQTFAGKVRRIGKFVTGHSIGDEVFGFLKTKWIQSVIRLSSELVMSKPPFLQLDQATIVPVNIYVACQVVARILKANSETKSILLIENETEKTILRAIADEAARRGICAQLSCQNKERTGNLAHSNQNQGKKDGDGRPQFDVILFASEINIHDHDDDLNLLQEDGILAVLNTKQGQTMRNMSFAKSFHLLNLQPFNDDIAGMCSAVQQNLCVDFKKNFDHLNVCILGFDEAINLNVKDDTSTANCLDLSSFAGRAELRPPSIDYQGLKDDCTYLVVGGTKGIGLFTVAWMASRGAGFIITLSRSDVPEESAIKFKHLESIYATKIVHLKLNISDQGSIDSLDAQLDNFPPIAGVVNSAGVLDDRPFQDIDSDSYKRVMSPKINGTLGLHSLLEKRNEIVDFFVLYSSITSIIGNGGQTSYSAANGFLNSFAEYRSEVLKKHCLAVCWGAMGGAGMLKDNAKVASLLEKTGFHLLDIETGLNWLEQVLLQTPTRSTVCICDIDWGKYLKTTQRENMTMFKHIRDRLSDDAVNDNAEILELIKQETSDEKRSEIVLKFITTWLANWIGGNEEEVDCNVPFFTYGIDSVGAAIFKAQIFQNFQVDLEVFYFMLPETTTTSLTKELVKKINEVIQKDANDFNADKAANGMPIERQTSSRRFYSSFRRIAPSHEVEDSLVLPEDYLSCIYDPPDAKAKIFMVHPSHRYAGIFRSMAAGMKYQELFSLWVFGSPDPSYIGEDIQSVRRLAIACTKKIVDIQPQGPYFIAGYSFGGLVAIDIASILQEMGRNIAMITMIDTFRWVPEAKSNCQFLMKGFTSSGHDKNILYEEMRGFFSRIATTQLQMTQLEFSDLVKKLSMEEVAAHLTNRAETLSVEISNLEKILQGTIGDQQMSKRCHHEWVPGDNLYNEHVLYIQAETCLCSSTANCGNISRCFCKTAVGSAPTCWSSIFENEISAMKCPGNHYTMMDQSRGPNVGKALACFASLRYRQLFQKLGRIALNSNHTAAVALFRERGLRVIILRKKLFLKTEYAGIVKLGTSGQKLKFYEESMVIGGFELALDDITNITIHDTVSYGNGIQSKSSYGDLYAGLRLQKKDNSSVIVMCYSKQDFRLFVFLIEALFMIKLPF